MIDRVKENEEKLDEITVAINDVKSSLDVLESLRNDIVDINKYYGSNLWFEDISNFESKEITCLKAGVLSEDAIWNMDESLKDLIIRMDKLKEIIIRSIKGE